MIKKSMAVSGVLILGLLFSSCSNSNSAAYSEETPENQEELQKLQQQNEQLQKDMKSLQSELDGFRSVWSTDLTGDGRNETITAPPWPTPESLFEEGGPLKVESPDGNILLDDKSGVLSAVGVYNVGAKTPVLVTLQWGGGSMGNYYGAYLYDSDTNMLKRLQWDQNEVAIGLLDDMECSFGSIVIEDRGLKPDGNNRPFYQRWIYEDGQMVPVEKWDAPL